MANRHQLLPSHLLYQEYVQGCHTYTHIKGITHRKEAAHTEKRQPASKLKAAPQSWKHLNHKQLLNNHRQKRLNLPKKSFYIQRQRSHNKMLGGALSRNPTGSSLGGLEVRIWCFHFCGLSSILSQGTEIP